MITKKRQRRHTKRLREKYSEVFNIDVPQDYDIHHLDHNYKNNEIINLVAIPRDLHRAYHELFDKYVNLGHSISSILLKLKTCKTELEDLRILYDCIIKFKYIQILANQNGKNNNILPTTCKG